MTMFQVGQKFEMESRFGKLVGRHMRRHLPRIFTGEATTRPYSLGLLKFMIQYGLNRENPDRLLVA